MMRSGFGIRFGLLIAPIVTVALVVLWLSAGSWSTGLLDRVFSVAVPAPTVEKVMYDGDFHIGDVSLTVGTPNNYPFPLDLETNAANKVVLTSGGHSFVLGPRTNPVDPHGRPDIDFIPDRGDRISLIATRSLLGWATPFEVNFMIRTPSWKRYVYYRLVWKKRSGAELAMFWRFEQDYYRGNGWTGPMMLWDFHTGLLRVDIRNPGHATAPP